MAHPIFSEDHGLIRAQLCRFVDERVRLHGPKWAEAGFVRDTAVERMSRNAMVQAIDGDASEVMLEEIAKRFGQAIAD